MKITLVAAARPNFMKIAPIIAALKTSIVNGKNIQIRLVHTGQHFDAKMSSAFFEELGIPHPDVNLECGGGTQAEQTGQIMLMFERDLLAFPTDLVLVVGDVTSTMACTIVAKKMQTKVGHVEAGIRSFDLSMPEEINRIVTDSITDYFFTTSEIASETLIKYGSKKESIFFVGNTMIDTLLKNQNKFIQPPIWNTIGLIKNNYFVITLHRPSNVDNAIQLKCLLEEIIKNARNLPIIFPVHPRTNKILQKIGIQASNLFLLEPLSYLQFNYLVKYAKAIITDSGGITEETTVMNVPCITLRDSTERPETISMGTNELIGSSPKNIPAVLKKLFDGNWKKGSIPPLWDGQAAERIVNCICNEFSL